MVGGSGRYHRVWTAQVCVISIGEQTGAGIWGGSQAPYLEELQGGPWPCPGAPPSQASLSLLLMRVTLHADGDGRLLLIIPLPLHWVSGDTELWRMGGGNARHLVQQLPSMRLPSLYISLKLVAPHLPSILHFLPAECLSDNIKTKRHVPCLLFSFYMRIRVMGELLLLTGAPLPALHMKTE